MGSSRRAIVVGAGAIGLATAVELAGAGWSVTVVDGRGPGGGMSGTTFAWLNANGKPPAAYFELNRAGLAAYRELAEREAPPWLRLTGHLEWAAGADARAALERRASSLLDAGYGVRRLSARDASRLEPDVRFPARAEVVYYPEEGHLLPAGFIGDLVRRARERGVRFVEGRVVALDRRRGELRVELADGGTFSAPVVVACVGRWTETFLEPLGAHVPMIPPAAGSRALGLLARTTPTAVRLERVVSSPGLNARPDGRGRLVLQAVDLDARARPDEDPPVDGALGREVARRAGRLFAVRGPVELERLAVAYRAIPADGLTVAGWVPGVEGVYVVATHSGMTLALVLGRLVATEIATGADEPRLAPFRPTRFSAAVRPPDH